MYALLTLEVACVIYFLGAIDDISCCAEQRLGRAGGLPGPRDADPQYGCSLSAGCVERGGQR